MGMERISNLTHRGADHLSVIARCAVGGNVYGVMPRRFRVKMVTKRGIKMDFRPLAMCALAFFIWWVFMLITQYIGSRIR